MVVQNVLTESDFEFQVLGNYAGRLLLHIPVTVRVSNVTGSEQVTDGTPNGIKAYFVRTSDVRDFEKAGLVEPAHAIMMTLFRDGIKRKDKIYTNPTSIISISLIDGDATTITVDTTSAHGLSAGDNVAIVGTINYEGYYTIASTPTGSQFTISDTSHDFASESTGSVHINPSLFEVKEALNVQGVFDTAGVGDVFVYTTSGLSLTDG